MSAHNIYELDCLIKKLLLKHHYFNFTELLFDTSLIALYKESTWMDKAKQIKEIFFEDLYISALKFAWLK